MRGVWCMGFLSASAQMRDRLCTADTLCGCDMFVEGTRCFGTGLGSPVSGPMRCLCNVLYCAEMRARCRMLDMGEIAGRPITRCMLATFRRYLADGPPVSAEMHLRSRRAGVCAQCKPDSRPPHSQVALARFPRDATGSGELLLLARRAGVCSISLRMRRVGSDCMLSCIPVIHADVAARSIV